jgi:outer membrane lipoprotein-sorting protein
MIAMPSVFRVFVALVFFPLSAWSQSDSRADQLLADVSEKMKAYPSVHARYSSIMVDRQSDFEMDQSGEVWIEGSRYHLQLGDYIIVCDGETVWTYEPDMGECYIDDAETIAEDGVDPARMFTIWEEGFKKVWKGEEEWEGKSLVRVDLYPDGSEERSFHTIQCFIDEDALQVTRLLVKGREGTDVEYRITEFEGNGLIPEGAFTFDKERYPGTTMIDNRL